MKRKKWLQKEKNRTMSELEKLMASFCPNGVQYMPLEAVAEMQRGTPITQKNIVPGAIPVIAGGQKPAYYCDKANRTGEVVTVAGSGAYAGYVAYWDTPVFVSDAFSVKAEENATTKYLFYALQNLQDKIYAAG